MIDDLISRFECFNDSAFKFDPKWHKYTYNGVKYTSVTKFLHNFHKPFEEDFLSKKKAEEAGVTQDVILKEWEEKRDRGNFVGHSTHTWIENYYNKIPQDVPTDLDIVDRINKFNIIYAKHLHKLSPLKFELRIFSKKYPIAGTLDSLFIYKGNIFILDWKTNGTFTHDEHYKGKYEKLLDPFKEYWKNHLNEYSIQVSLYSMILEEWGFETKGAYLVHIGPDSEAKIHKAHDFKEQLKTYLPTHIF